MTCQPMAMSAVVRMRAEIWCRERVGHTFTDLDGHHRSALQSHQKMSMTASYGTRSWSCPQTRFRLLGRNRRRLNVEIQHGGDCDLPQNTLTEREEETKCSHGETQHWRNSTRFEQGGGMQDCPVATECDHQINFLGFRTCGGLHSVGGTKRGGIGTTHQVTIY
jgi:hypothetical protein